MVVVLGIDPGSRFTGYGVIRHSGAGFAVLASGVIRLHPRSTHAERIGQIYRELEEVIADFRPRRVALETAFLSRNVQSALKLGQVRGAIIALAMNRKLLLHEYAPREVKLAVTGKGAASKEQVASMVARVLALTPIPEPFDVTDALGIALCDLLRGERPEHLRQFGKSWKGGSNWSKFVQASPDMVIR
jgi:crossover junction endodeoxyribonuclease RuvC